MYRLVSGFFLNLIVRHVIQVKDQEKWMVFNEIDL